MRPYSEGDFTVLERTLGDPKMTVHLGGPESPEKIRQRHERFLAMSAAPSKGCMFTITVLLGNVAVGNVGY